MVYISKADRPFVYGDFAFGPPRSRLSAPPGMQPFAVEILREYSANEFIGKLYQRTPIGGWRPASLQDLSKYQWFSLYSKVRRHLHFEMEGSGRWEVEHFREESNESGPYLAVALKFQKTA